MLLHLGTAVHVRGSLHQLLLSVQLAMQHAWLLLLVVRASPQTPPLSPPHSLCGPLLLLPLLSGPQTPLLLHPPWPQLSPSWICRPCLPCAPQLHHH